MAKSKEMQAKKKPRGWRVTRRGFLIGMGVTGVGVALGWRFGLPEAQLAIARRLDNATAPGGPEGAPNAWLEVSPDNSVTLYLTKAEMGQGVHTSLAQLAAEELEIPWENLSVKNASTLRGIDDPFGTGGSSTISSSFKPLREAAATLREMLRERAASIWKIEKAYVVAMDGAFFQQQNPETKLTYGEVIAQSTGEWQIPKEKVALKPVSEFKVIGQSMPRKDFEAKLTGKAVYGYDARLEGMLYGAVARPPTLTATLKSAAPGKAETLENVKVVIEEGFAGVVADSRAKARQAVELLELEWTPGAVIQQADLENLTTVAAKGGTVIQREGAVSFTTVRSAFKENVIEAEYRSPFATHAHLEPQAALVDVQPNKVVAFVSTQSPQSVRDELAELLGRKKEEVELTATFLGGGFGRRLNVEVALEAARLSRAVGKPVHVGWNRAEEFQYGYVRPATHSVLKASLENGKISAFEHQQASGDVAFPFFPAIAGTILGADFGSWRGALVHYSGVQNRRTVAHRVKLPIRTGWWRSLGLLANTFALESFMDELAHEAGADPLEFRLAHFADDEQGQRFKKVLQTVAEKAGWNTPLPAGCARGIACSTDVKTIVAQVAEVSVENSKIRVHKMTAAVDPGLVVNPDGCIAQTQGSVVMGLSSTLLERITIKDSKIEANNFDLYPLLTLRDTPEISVTLLESGEEPYGMGEPPLGPVAAAVANAVFALTGQRLRTLPLELSA
jgi:isoquinoline 1-oxidoreductase subunit beta